MQTLRQRTEQGATRAVGHGDHDFADTEPCDRIRQAVRAAEHRDAVHLPAPQLSVIVHEADDRRMRTGLAEESQRRAAGVRRSEDEDVLVEREVCDEPDVDEPPAQCQQRPFPQDVERHQSGQLVARRVEVDDQVGGKQRDDPPGEGPGPYPAPPGPS